MSFDKDKRMFFIISVPNAMLTDDKDTDFFIRITRIDTVLSVNLFLKNIVKRVALFVFSYFWLLPYLCGMKTVIDLSVPKSWQWKDIFFSRLETPFCPPVLILLLPVFLVFVFYNRGKSMAFRLGRPAFSVFSFREFPPYLCIAFRKAKGSLKTIYRHLDEYLQMFEQISTDVWLNILRYFEKGLWDHHYIIY